jgi:glutamine cyclotransferase
LFPYVQSALSVFLFFVFLGTKSNARRGDDKLVHPKIDVGQPQLFRYVVMKEYDHDPAAFTQGLLYEEQCDDKGKACKEVIFESTGLYGQSTIRQVDLASGKVLRSKALPKSDFGEGLTRHGDRLFQVTWKSSTLWSYAAKNFDDAKKLKVWCVPMHSALPCVQPSLLVSPVHM